MTQPQIPEQFIGNSVVLTELSSLGFSTRTENGLKAENLFYIFDVLSKDRESMLEIPNFSNKSYLEVTDKLEELGITSPIDHAAIASILKNCRQDEGDYLDNVRGAFQLPQERIAPRKKTSIIPVDGQIKISDSGTIECAFKLSPILKVAIEEGMIDVRQLNEIFERHVQQANLETTTILKDCLTMR